MVALLGGTACRSGNSVTKAGGPIEKRVSKSWMGGGLLDAAQNETLIPPLTPKSLPPARAKVVTAFTIALIFGVIAVATPPATLP
jgi:hypothetical protein